MPKRIVRNAAGFSQVENNGFGLQKLTASLYRGNWRTQQSKGAQGQRPNRIWSLDSRCCFQTRLCKPPPASRLRLSAHRLYFPQTSYAQHQIKAMKTIDDIPSISNTRWKVWVAAELVVIVGDKLAIVVP